MQNLTDNSTSERTPGSFWEHKDQGCEWKNINHLGVGDIIWAPLKHPYHRDVYMRYYLIVSKETGKTAEGYLYETLAVVSLETNGGRGREAYPQTAQRFLKDIKLMGEGDGADDLEIRGWMPYDNKWRLLSKTTVDLSTILLVRSKVRSDFAPLLFCRDVGNLTTASAGKVADFYKEFMRHWSYATYMTTRTEKVPNTSTERPASKGLPLPDNSSHVMVTIFDPQKDIHVSLSDKGAQEKSQKLDSIVGKKGFSDYLDTIKDPKERLEVHIQALVDARKKEEDEE